MYLTMCCSCAMWPNPAELGLGHPSTPGESQVATEVIYIYIHPGKVETLRILMIPEYIT